MLTEEEVLQYWKDNKVFERSLKKNEGKNAFVFFEGPPTANGHPGFHHAIARTFKDVICRYKTMQGYYVLRKAGWDTQGLPVELEVEKELGLKHKSEIEQYGIAEFNKKCKESVWKYKDEWEKFTNRMGYWLDLKKPDVTYENNYIESIWHILKTIWDKELIYQDYKVVPYCPRCGTALSDHEVAQGYRMTSDPSIFIKFKLKNESNTFFYVWTTTPWTLPGNVALAVNPEAEYAKIKLETGEIWILALDRLGEVKRAYEILEQLSGKKLSGLEYEPLFTYIKPEKSAYKVVTANFVTLSDGTGIVHIAPAFGTEDLEVSREYDLPILMTINSEGNFIDEIKPYAGIFVKDADSLIIKELKDKGLIDRSETAPHEYPFCWRCKTPLLYYAKKSWYIKMTAVKDQLLKNNDAINWVPEYIKNGRFGNWLDNVVDWAISRERYWGTSLLILQCEQGDFIVVGSKEELVKHSKNKLPDNLDFHRPFIDDVVLVCPTHNLDARRIPEVLDAWFDSGSMPYAQWHYPFENSEMFNQQFPADFISEGVDQTRGWFYTLLAISTLLEKGPAYKNVISLGHVLDKKGQKMSKSKGNTVDPWEIIAKYGIDPLRWYFFTVNEPGEPKRFDEKDILKSKQGFFSTLLNSLQFYTLYKDQSNKQINNAHHLLDDWILSEFDRLVELVSDHFSNYEPVKAARAIEKFVSDLSNWYIRLSRKRMDQASDVLFEILKNLSKLIAPFCPFFAESMWQSLGQNSSVHLQDYPITEGIVNAALSENM